MTQFTNYIYVTWLQKLIGQKMYDYTLLPAQWTGALTSYYDEAIIVA